MTFTLGWREREKKNPFSFKHLTPLFGQEVSNACAFCADQCRRLRPFRREVSRHCSPKTKDLPLCASMKERVVAQHSRHIHRHQGWLLAPVSVYVPAWGDANACLRCQSPHQERECKKKGRKKKTQMDAKWEWQIQQKCLSTTPASQNVVRQGEESRREQRRWNNSNNGGREGWERTAKIGKKIYEKIT